MDPAANDVAILHRHEIDGVVPGTGDVAVLHIDVLALVDLQRLLRHGVGGYVAKASDGRIAEEHVGTAVEVEHVAAAGRDVEAEKIEVAAVVDIHVRQAGRAVAVDRLEQHGRRLCAVPALPVDGYR